MSKYNHFEMCEKIFGQKCKWNEQKDAYEPYSRTDMWNKLIEQQEQIADLETKLAESEEELQIYKLEELADTVADLGMPKVSKYQLWQSIEDQHSRNMVLEKRLEMANEEIAQLKQQLADTETQNKRVLEKLELIVAVNQELEQVKNGLRYEKTIRAELYKLQINQTAIDTLEKVKKIVSKTDEKGYLIRFANSDERFKFYEEIDKQIKQLKKEQK